MLDQKTIMQSRDALRDQARLLAADIRARGQNPPSMPQSSDALEEIERLAGHVELLRQMQKTENGQSKGTAQRSADQAGSDALARCRARYTGSTLQLIEANPAKLAAAMDPLAIALKNQVGCTGATLKCLQAKTQ